MRFPSAKRRRAEDEFATVFRGLPIRFAANHVAGCVQSPL